MPPRSPKLAAVYSNNHSDTGCGVTIVIMSAVAFILLFSYFFT